MKNRYFIITVDTEGDNLWGTKPEINKLILPTTRNISGIIRFQELCEKFNFPVTYFTSYDMACNQWFVETAKNIIKKKTGEIGMHMHAFSTPPFYPLIDMRGGGLAYANEFPSKIIWEKYHYMTGLLEDTFQLPITSHRGGRWCLNNHILKDLDKLGYIVDCSITPGVNWSKHKGQTLKSKGNDYTKYKSKPYKIKNTNMWELPVSIYPSWKLNFSFVHRGDKLLKKELLWMRPFPGNLDKMKKIVKSAFLYRSNYIEFMIHSSELHPDTNLTFKGKKSIEQLFNDIESLFIFLKNKGYYGITCTDYVKGELGFGKK